MKFGERLTAFVARLTPTQKAAAGVLVLALAVGGTVGGLVAAGPGSSDPAALSAIPPPPSTSSTPIPNHKLTPKSKPKP